VCNLVFFPPPCMQTCVYSGRCGLWRGLPPTEIFLPRYIIYILAQVFFFLIFLYDAAVSGGLCFATHRDILAQVFSINKSLTCLYNSFAHVCMHVQFCRVWKFCFCCE